MRSDRTCALPGIGFLFAVIATSVHAIVPIGHEAYINTTTTNGGGIPIGVEAISEDEYVAVFQAIPSPAPFHPSHTIDGVFMRLYQGAEQSDPIWIADSGPWLRKLHPTDDRSFLMANRNGEVLRISIDSGEVESYTAIHLENQVVRDFAAAPDGRSAFLVLNTRTELHEVLRLSPEMDRLEDVVTFSSYINSAITPSDKPRIALSPGGTIAVGFENSQDFNSGNAALNDLWAQSFTWDGEGLMEPTRLPVSDNRGGEVWSLRALGDGRVVVVGRFCCKGGASDYAIGYWEVLADGSVNGAGTVSISSDVVADILPDGNVLAIVTPDDISPIRTEIRNLLRITSAGTEDLGPVDVAFDFDDRSQLLSSFDGSHARLAWTYTLDQQRHARTQMFDLNASPLGGDSVEFVSVDACIADVNSITTLRWPAGMEVRMARPDGRSLGTGGHYTTGLWAKYGFMFYLIDPVTEATITATKLRLDGRQPDRSTAREPGPCPAHRYQLDPPTVCDLLNTVTIRPIADVPAFIDIRVNAVDGPLMFSGSGTTGFTTPNWVRHNTRFFIIDRTTGNLEDVLIAKAGNECP